MKILYDHQIFSTQAVGGISRYYAELINAIRRQDEHECRISAIFSKNPYLESQDKLLKIKLKLPRKIDRWLYRINLYKSMQAINSDDYDIFHPTYYDPYFLSIIHKPYVLTIHDMIHEIFPTKYSQRDKTIQNKKLLVEHAARIIAVSNNTKNDIVKYYHIDEQKIDVVYHGSSLLKQDDRKKTNINVPSRYILYVGGRSFYKNFIFFIEAIVSILCKDKSLYVVCVGGEEFKSGENKFFERLGLKNQLLQLVVGDAELSQIYTLAQALAVPSIYEGFGLPVLEAFNCSCPVIISNRSSLPEVGGDAAVYFDPTDKDSICQSVRQVIYDENMKQYLRQEGGKQLRKFSWSETARKTLEVYGKVAKIYEKQEPHKRIKAIHHGIYNV